MTAVEYAINGRSPYPPHWGPPSDAENRRIGWALSHIRQDTAARNTRRLATVHRRRYDPDGWCTVLFNAFLQQKLGTQRIRGGNTAAFCTAEGTLPKSRMLVRMHPDVAQLTRKFGRWHHEVNYRPFAGNRLRLRPGVEIPDGPSPA